MNDLQAFWRGLPAFFDSYHPFFTHLCVTERCNLRCRYCQVWKHPHAELSTDEFKLVIRRIYEMGVLILSFTGGEPFMRDDIFELIDFAVKIGFVTGITTNGTMSLDKYKALLKTNIDRISVSLDGISGCDLPHS